MLIKVRKLGPTFSTPQIKKTGDMLAMQAEGIGELVKCPEMFREQAELLVGELSMTFFPIGIEVKIDDGGELNGLWVQKAIYDSLRNQAQVAA
jgi:hypothetical protein